MRFFGWVDHDPEQEQSVLRALGAAKGRDARDELGLGTIRDTLADLLFPGTSTIQQRARYFLLVQWCCELAARKRGADAIIDELHRLEVRLIKNLKWLGRGAGVIGLNKQEDLGRMPSEIYWNGLLVIGLRRVQGNRQRWAHMVATHREGAKREARWEDQDAGDVLGFDGNRPEPPTGFPEIEGLDFTLTSKEAAFIRGCLKRGCVNQNGAGLQYNAFPTFLTHVRPTRAAVAWDHPCAGKLPAASRDLLMLAAAFSHVMHGATLLYNVRVAELRIDEGGSIAVCEAHARSLTEWRKTLARSDAELLLARIDDLPALGALARHSVDPAVLGFVRGWAGLCLAKPDRISSREAVALVSQREIDLKRANGTSRILFSKARERWSGQSGGELDYRWPLVKQYLNDLAVR